MGTVASCVVSCVIWLLIIFTCLPFLILTYAYRFVLSKLVPLFNSKIHRIIPPRSAMFLQRDVSKDFNVGLLFGVEGIVELQRLRQYFETRVLLRKDSAGELLRSELQQFPLLKFGYYFWEWEENFKIENHIKLLEIDSTWDQKPKIAQEILQVFEEKVLRRPWIKGQSPWELFVVNNFQDTPIFGSDSSTCYSGTLLILRVHHVLGDGTTLGTILQDLFCIYDNSKLDTATTKPETTAVSRGFKTRLYRYFFGPLEMHKTMSRRKKANQWYIRDSLKPKPLSHKSNVGLTQTIPLEVIKKIRRSQDVCFTAVIFTLLVRAYARFVLMAGYDVPDKLVCAATYLVPGHPQVKMRNHNTLLGIEVALHSEGAELFKEIDAEIRREKSSGSGEFLFNGMGVLGSLCVCVRDQPSDAFSEGVFVLTNAIIADRDIWLEEGLNRLRTVFSLSNVQAGGSGFSCVAITLKDGVRVVLQLDESIVSKEEVSATIFAQFFMEEVEAWSGNPV